MTLPHRVALGTKHGKSAAIAPPLGRIGIAVSVPEGLDTDKFGTFTGEVARLGSMLDAARAKARSACKLTGLDVGIGSEGSYGPHPSIPILPLGREVLLLWDRTTGREIVEQVVDDQPRLASRYVADVDDLDDLIAQTDFPRTNFVVSPAGTTDYVKGLKTLPELVAAVGQAIAQSEGRRALVQTDMRANHNPRRMHTIARAAEALAERLSRNCPRCGSYGWGLVEVERGLPCSACGMPTPLVGNEVHGCTACRHSERAARGNGLATADPRHCPHCNP